MALAVSGGAAAQGSCLGSAVTIPGTSGDDMLIGTEGDDVIDAQGGNDFVDGLGGNDKICLGAGNDTAEGGDGNDQIEGASGDDTIAGDFLESTQAGTGDDDVAGGDGEDIVVGDVANSAGSAAGEGDDKVNGGGGNDIVVGDAFSATLSAGTGEDDIDSGPGTDLVVGDALTGTPAVPAEAGAMALGTGGDVINTQTETDAIVGDAAVFGPDSAARRGSGAVDVLAECSKVAARRAELLRSLGLSDEEILDFIPDRIRAEFQKDLIVGDCLGVRGEARGAAADDLNAGTENDAVIGDSAGTEGSSGRQPGLENHLGGKGDDLMWGDNTDVVLVTPFGLRFGRGNPSARADFDPRERLLAFLVGGPGGVALYQYTHEISLTLDPPSPRRMSMPPARRAKPDFGGKDHVRGGKGSDYLEGGPAKDKCSGGPQKDVFVESGPLKCEEITGAP